MKAGAPSGAGVFVLLETLQILNCSKNFRHFFERSRFISRWLCLLSSLLSLESVMDGRTKKNTYVLRIAHCATILNVLKKWKNKSNKCPS